MILVDRFIHWVVRRKDEDAIPELQSRLKKVKKERDKWMKSYFHLEGEVEDAVKNRFRQAFGVPGLTGVWRYHRKCGKPRWCASYVERDGSCDTEDFDSPWEALESARKEQE